MNQEQGNTHHPAPIKRHRENGQPCYQTLHLQLGKREKLAYALHSVQMCCFHIKEDSKGLSPNWDT